MQETTLLLIRHGRSNGNLEKRFQGSRADSPLSGIGIREAELLRDGLISQEIHAVYTSPMQRAKATAQIAFGERAIPIIENYGLLERDFGSLDGLTIDEAKVAHPLAEKFYSGELAEFNAPGVEKITSIQNRSVQALEKIAQEHKGKTVAVVSHGFWIKSAIAKILGVPFEEARKHSVKNSSVTIVRAKHWQDAIVFEVGKIGDKAHLGNWLVEE